MTRHQATLVIAGPDGAGKSSLAGAVIEQLLTLPTLHIHHRPGVLPRSAAAKEVVTEPHATAPYPWWLSVVKLFYLWADYQLGWWLRLRPTRRRGGAVVIERGWADLAVDPLRYRMVGVRWLTGVLERLLPKPDLVIVLLADAATLLARQEELPAAEITRQVAVWRRWARDRSYAVVVDAALPSAEMVAAVRRELERVAQSAPG